MPQYYDLFRGHKSLLLGSSDDFYSMKQLREVSCLPWTYFDGANPAYHVHYFLQRVLGGYTQEIEPEDGSPENWNNY